MNSIKAGFYILNIFAISDSHIDPSEVTIIFDFLAENFEGEFNLEEEVLLLDSLSPQAKMDLFYQSADYLQRFVSLRSKINLLEYVIDLIIVDKQLARQELDLLDYLGNLWGIDTQKLLEEKLRAE